VSRVVRVAYEKLASCDRDDKIYAQILDSTALMWGHRGLFQRAAVILRTAYDLCLRQEPKD
jgi:hypothetical protein